MSQASATATARRGVWAATARCPRAGYYTATGAPAADATEQEKRLWQRGRDCERHVLARLASGFGGENIDTLRLLDWPGGKAHPDAVVIPERLTVEVKSRVDLSEIHEHEVVQTGGYVHMDDESDRGALVIVSPVDYEERVVPVTLNDRLLARVAEAIERVTRGLEGGGEPDRVCVTPSEARSRRCPFADHCFRGWQAPDPIRLDGRVARLARELLRAERASEHASAEASRVKAARDEIRGQLRELTEPGREYEAAGVLVKRSAWTRTSYQVAKAVECGAVETDALAAFASTSEQERWTVRQTQDELPELPDEYGDVPF